MATAPAVAWGALALDLELGGMRFQFGGLNSRQRDALARTYGRFLPSARRGDGVVLETVVEQIGAALLRDARPHGLALEPVVLTRLPERVRLAGQDFLAEIPLGDREPARLLLADEAALADRTVSENYLRVAAAYYVLARGGLLLHSSGLVLDGRAHLFLGCSGAGKTTLARKGQAAGATVLSDDINVLVRRDGALVAYSQPFAGELGDAAGDPRVAHPVAALHWLAPGRELGLEPLSRERRLTCLLVAAPFVNSDAERFDRLVDTVEAVARSVPMFRLCSRREDSFESLARALTEIAA